LGCGPSQRDLLKRLELSPEDHRRILRRCRKRRILFLSSPFDEESADFLEFLGVPAFKIGSGELTNIPFLQHVARKGRPMIVSTGMATLDETRRAVRAIRRTGNAGIILLHCVSAYPASPNDANLRAMETLRRTFHTPVGFSDHTLGLSVPLAAVALGAEVIEKHFTMNRSLPGPDHGMSLDPRELASLVRGVREVAAALGDGRKIPKDSEKEVALVARKSLVAARDLKTGERMDASALVVRRPGSGLSPDCLPHLLGRRLRRDVRSGILVRQEWFR